MAQLETNLLFKKVADFALAEPANIPDTALNMAMTLLLDTLGVAAAATQLDAGKIARDFAADFYGASDSRYHTQILFDGRRTGPAGAAYAIATQTDNLDAHDGYNPTKGHIGCAVIPALCAFAQITPHLNGRQALEAVVIAYEVAARAGLALHASVSDYHTSGAWNALGVAALCCRLLNSDSTVLREALGIAEYHGPRSQMMREIDNPSMLHDGSGMGAMIGVSSALLASRGFCGAPAITVESEETAAYWTDLGRHWTIEKNYIKPYPICRWAHAAIDAVQQLMHQHSFKAEDVETVKIRTFHEASKLYSGIPDTTSQAQYSMAYAVATMLRYGKITPEHLCGDALHNPQTAAMIKKINVCEDQRHNARFPHGRWSDVSLTLLDGRVLESGDVHARGGQEAPFSQQQIIDKFHELADPVLGVDRARMIVAGCFDLIQRNSRFSEFIELLVKPAEPA